MDSSSASEIHRIYSGLITGFTINHAKLGLLRQMMSRCAGEAGGEYLIRVTKSHTKLINRKTRQVVNDEGELRQVRKMLQLEPLQPELSVQVHT